MKKTSLSLAFSAALLAAAPAAADDFQVTFHVDRVPTTQLSLDACTNTIEQAAKTAGYRAIVKRYPGQLGTVSAGPDKGGSFLAHCIVVDDKVVTVIQGFDYSDRKGPLGEFADNVRKSLAASVKN